MGRDAFWTDPEIVERFRGRDPDIHLAALLDSAEDASALRTLDLGCAAGRNAVALRDREVPFVAVDASTAMCRATYDRVGRDVTRARMDSLPFPDASFDLVAALGVYHEASSDDELRRAAAETSRVLKPGGAVLLSVFSRAMVPPEVRLAPGQSFTFELPTRGPSVRLAEDQLLDVFGEAGLEAAVPVEVRRGASETKTRISLLGLFARR